MVSKRGERRIGDRVKYVPRPCAEFPNDNPSLHDGVVWVCTASRARPRAVVLAPTVGRRQGPGLAARGAVPAAPVPEPASEIVPVPAPLSDEGAAAPPADAPSATDQLTAPTQQLLASEMELPVAGEGAAAVEARLGEAAGTVEADDPFVEELEALIEGWEQTPPLPVAQPSAANAQRPAGVEAAVVQPLEPLVLELTPLPPASSAWQELSERLSSWLLQTGATRAAALLSSLLEGNPTSLQRLARPARECLLAQGMAELRDGDVVPSKPLLRRARRFQMDFLSGRLDEPAAVDWLGRLLGGLLAQQLDERAVRDALGQCGALQLLTRAA